MKKNSLLNTIFLYFLIACIILVGLTLFKNYSLLKQPLSQLYSYNSLINDLENNNTEDISRITIKPEENNTGYATVIFKDSSKKNVTIEIPSMSSFMEFLHANLQDTDIIITQKADKQSSISNYIIPTILVIIVVITIIAIFVGQDKGGISRTSNFARNRAKLINPALDKVTFKDVAGLAEEKSDLEEIVEFLKYPKRFEEIGARIPKGVLLVGPPGTGKTLLARAIAGEADVKFFSISGSDFVEMFVGVGASRVRDLFEEAKKNKPALIFIDEIDAVGRRRGSGLGGGHDEREQTLNQLLVEMDGFTKNEGLIVLAATNRPDILDPALLRPGRFDRQVVVGPPDVKGREEILNVHIKNKKLHEDVDIKELAKMTSGFTGAELENLLNEAALLAAKNDEKNIQMKHIRKAFIKVGVGTERKSRVVSLEEKEITAYHEAGHAILFEMLNLLDHVHLVSIIPTGTAGGYTMPLPVDKGYLSKKYLIQHIISLFGGRVAEDIIFEDITTGASNDIERATETAYSMVSKFGMSSLGPRQFDPKKNSNTLSSEIDKEVEKIIFNAYEEAKSIILDNIDILHTCAKLLLEKEKISGDEFRALFPPNKLPEKKKPTLPPEEEDTANSEDNIDKNNNTDANDFKNNINNSDDNNFNSNNMNNSDANNFNSNNINNYDNNIDLSDNNSNNNDFNTDNNKI